MRVAVVSDTHGCLSMLDRCIKLAGQVDVWCHLGDLTSDAEALMSRTNAKVYAVNPGSPSCPRGGRSPSFALLEIENGDVRAEIITM